MIFNSETYCCTVSLTQFGVESDLQITPENSADFRELKLPKILTIKCVREAPRRKTWIWCGRRDSNPHSCYRTATSTLRVYQFRHDRYVLGRFAI